MDYQANKALITRFYEDLDNAGPDQVASVLADYVAEGYLMYAVHPFGELAGTGAVADRIWAPLKTHWTGLQRRQMLFFAGTSEIDGTDWVVSMGLLMGLLDGDWLGIPATGRLTCLRYADFNCIQEGRITRSGFFCDIIDVMQQAGVDPLPPATAAPGIWPSPRTQDGLIFEAQDPREGVATLALIDRMVDDLNRLNKSGEDHCPPEYLARTWDKNMAWYGPAGIGATYTILRYQHQHQFPYRDGVQDKVFNGHICRLAEGNYGGFFGWPNLKHRPVGGFLGLPGHGKPVDMRVVDMYRREGDKLVENWILIDLPWWLKQQGLDVFARLAALLAR
jgi:hypothetical protein